jgi:hypothetical protein
VDDSSGTQKELLLDWGQSCQNFQPIARFGMIRARFDKRSTPAFRKAAYRSDIRNAPRPDSDID